MGSDSGKFTVATDHAIGKKIVDSLISETDEHKFYSQLGSVFPEDMRFEIALKRRKMLMEKEPISENSAVILELLEASISRLEDLVFKIKDKCDSK